jgi:hypothetical protein
MFQNDIHYAANDRGFYFIIFSHLNCFLQQLRKSAYTPGDKYEGKD